MLLDRIDQYLRASKCTPTRFGREAVGDPNFVTNLRDGRRPRPTTLERVIAFLEREERRRRQGGPAPFPSVAERGDRNAGGRIRR